MALIERILVEVHMQPMKIYHFSNSERFLFIANQACQTRRKEFEDAVISRFKVQSMVYTCEHVSVCY